MFDIPCVILAGGKSSRMKEDKCFLSFANTTLIEYQYNKLKQIFKYVYISSKKNKFKFPCDVILEQNKLYSPIIALDSILDNFTHQKIFIIPVDTPNISKKTIEKLLTTSRNHSICVIKTHDNKVHNLCGVFSHSIQKNIKNMINDNNHKVSILLETSDTKLCYIKNNNEFLNINTKEDYKHFINSLD
jgi:molybdopterin-guanine dinucleotide biosynthesis protein A